MITRVLLFFPLLPLTGLSLPQARDSTQIHTVTVRGVNQLYNLDFQSAEVTFDSVIVLAPDDPRGHFFKAMVFYWKYILTGDKKLLEIFLQQSEGVIDRCTDLLDKNPENGLIKFYLGGIYGYRGLAYQRDGSLLSAVWNGRKGYSYLERAVNQHQRIYDAQMGFGLFKYLIARVPSSFRWILNLLGFSGDRETGLQALKLAADSGTYSRSEAAFFYAQFCYFEDRQEDAYAYLERLLRSHPQNTLFLITYASWEFRNNNLETAMSSAERAIAINTERNIKYGDEFAYSVMAGFHFAQNNFPKAIEFAERSIENTENKRNVFNNTYYRLGLSYEMTGNRVKAAEVYRKAAKADPEDNPWQYHFWRRAQQRIDQPLDVLDSLAVIAGNASTLKQYDKALLIYQRIIEQTPSPEKQASALYETAGIHFEREQFEQTLQTLERVLDLTLTEETWIHPHAHLMMARALKRLGRTEQAMIHLEAIEDFDEYDFQSRIETQAEDELEKLRGSD